MKQEVVIKQLWESVMQNRDFWGKRRGIMDIEEVKVYGALCAAVRASEDSGWMPSACMD